MKIYTCFFFFTHTNKSGTKKIDKIVPKVAIYRVRFFFKDLTRVYCKLGYLYRFSKKKKKKNHCNFRTLYFVV